MRVSHPVVVDIVAHGEAYLSQRVRHAVTDADAAQVDVDVGRVGVAGDDGSGECRDVVAGVALACDGVAEKQLADAIQSQRSPAGTVPILLLRSARTENV